MAGDDELDVLADYGWVQITERERWAIQRGLEELEGVLNLGACSDEEASATLRSLLERTK